MNVQDRFRFVEVLLEEWNKGTGAVHSRVLEERTGTSHANTDAFLMQLTEITPMIRSHYEPGNARAIIVTNVDTASLSEFLRSQ